ALTFSAMTLHDLARGVSIDRVMTAQVALNDPRYEEEPERLVRAAKAIVGRLSSSPVVETAALVNYPPLSLIRVGVRLTIEAIQAPLDRPWIARYFITSPGYFRATGIQMISGRDFTAADDMRHADVAIVSETLARRFWSTTDVIGRRLRPEFP